MAIKTRHPISPPAILTTRETIFPPKLLTPTAPNFPHLLSPKLSRQQQFPSSCPFAQPLRRAVGHSLALLSHSQRRDNGTFNNIISKTNPLLSVSLTR
jgi:CRISPR/Cas system endoribonuclease Cas6 (RAMP superfamily)